MKDSNRFKCFIIHLKVMITDFKDENRKSKKNKINKELTTIMKTVDVSVFFANTQSFATLSVTGFGVIVTLI